MSTHAEHSEEAEENGERPDGEKWHTVSTRGTAVHSRTSQPLANAGHEEAERHETHTERGQPQRLAHLKDLP
jgi:hypothetical protein